MLVIFAAFGLGPGQNLKQTRTRISRLGLFANNLLNHTALGVADSYRLLNTGLFRVFDDIRCWPDIGSSARLNEIRVRVAIATSEAGIIFLPFLTRSMRTSRRECGIGLSHRNQSAVPVVPVDQNLTIRQIRKANPINK